MFIRPKKKCLIVKPKKKSLTSHLIMAISKEKVAALYPNRRSPMDRFEMSRVIDDFSRINTFQKRTIDKFGEIPYSDCVLDITVNCDDTEESFRRVHFIIDNHMCRQLGLGSLCDAIDQTSNVLKRALLDKVQELYKRY